MLQKKKFERINKPTTSAFIAITQTIKSRTALPNKRITIVKATKVLIYRSAASKSPFYVPGTPNSSFLNTDTVPSIFARSKIEKNTLSITNIKTPITNYTSNISTNQENA
jgi:hypothetical protein